jgi:hypothetical protein
MPLSALYLFLTLELKSKEIYNYKFYFIVRRKHIPHKYASLTIALSENT